MRRAQSTAAHGTRAPSRSPRPSSSYLVSSVEPFTLLLSLKVSKTLSSGRGGRGAGINYDKKQSSFNPYCCRVPPYL